MSSQPLSLLVHEREQYIPNFAPIQWPTSTLTGRPILVNFLPSKL